MYLVAVLGRGIVPPDSPVFRADDAAPTRGDGCFETLLVRDRVPAKADAHFARLRRSADALGLDLDEPAWRALIDEALVHAPVGEVIMKLIVSRGHAGVLTLSPVPAETLALRRDGLRVVTLDRGYAATSFTDAPWLLGGVKTLSYAVNLAAVREAERRGAHDAIFVSSDGWVLESSTGTAVWATGRTLTTTPPGAGGILRGTTQERLFGTAAEAGWQVRTGLVRVEDLHAADALWLVSSVRGVVEVVELDGKGRPSTPDLTADLRRFAGF